jgi:small subunit ribosomal protein S19e
MVSTIDCDAQKHVRAMADELKKHVKQPEWSLFIKTGVSKERPPEQKDWWYLRAASILRRIYIDGPVGVQKLRSYYGGRHRRGHKPAHFAEGGGKILRVILQDLEKAGFVKKADKKKGRIITSQGEKFLVSAAKTTK